MNILAAGEYCLAPVSYATFQKKEGKKGKRSFYTVEWPPGKRYPRTYFRPDHFQINLLTEKLGKSSATHSEKRARSRQLTCDSHNLRYRFRTFAIFKSFVWKTADFSKTKPSI